MLRRKSFGRWRPMPLIKVPEVFTIPDPAPNARPTNGPISNFINTQSDWFGWQAVDVFEPQLANGRPYTGTYYVGFAALDEEGNEAFAMKCTLLLRGRIGMLIGPGKAKFFVTVSEAEDGAVHLVEVERTTRSNLDKSTPLI